MSRSAIRDNPKKPSTPRGRPLIEHRFLMRMGDEFRGSARSLAYAAARCSVVVFGFFTIAPVLAFGKFRRQLLPPLFLTTADVFAMSR
jgi:hypothetical protein